MIRFVFRFLGLWILAAGFVFLVRDGTKSIAGNSVFMTSLRDDWNNIHGTSLDLLQALTEKYAGAGAVGVRVGLCSGARRPGSCSVSSARS